MDGSPTSARYLCSSNDDDDGASFAADVGSISCSAEHAPNIRVTPGDACAKVDAELEPISASDLALAEIGWLVEDKFHLQILVCHDERYDDTLFTRHVLIGAAIENRDKTSGRPPFRRDLKGKRDDRWDKLA